MADPVVIENPMPLRGGKKKDTSKASGDEAKRSIVKGAFDAVKKVAEESVNALSGDTSSSDGEDVSSGEDVVDKRIPDSRETSPRERGNASLMSEFARRRDDDKSIWSGYDNSTVDVEDDFFPIVEKKDAEEVRGHWDDRRAKMSQSPNSDSFSSLYDIAEENELNQLVPWGSGARFSYDLGSGAVVDSEVDRIKERRPISEEMRKRSGDGEDMQPMTRGQYLMTDDPNRVKIGYGTTKTGDNTLIAMLSGRPSESAVKAGGGPVGDVVWGAQNLLKDVESSVANARNSWAKGAADYDLVTDNGTRVDEDYFIRAMNSDPGYWDDLQRALGKRSAPYSGDMPEILRMNEGGDDDGIRYGKPDEQAVKDIVAMYTAPQVLVDGEDLGPVPQNEDGSFALRGGDITFDPDTGEMTVLGKPVPWDTLDDGRPWPRNLDFSDMEPTDDMSSAAAYRVHDPLTVYGRNDLRRNMPLYEDAGMELPAKDVMDIMSGTVYRENKNDWNPIMKVAEDIDITGEDGHLDVLKLMTPSNLIPLSIDAGLSTLPYIDKRVAIPVVANNIALSATGVDSTTYDPVTDTYENPGARSRDEYSGNIIKTAAEYGSDYVLGGFGPIAGRAKSLFGGSAGRSAAKAVKDAQANTSAKIMARAAKDIGVTAGIEGVQETVPEYFSPLEHGFDSSLYYASQVKDENGNVVYDEFGKPVLDPSTSFAERGRNLADSVIPSFVLGGIAGSGLGAPGQVTKAIGDIKNVRENSGYRGVEHDFSSAALSPEAKEELIRSYTAYLDEMMAREEKTDGQG